MQVSDFLLMPSRVEPCGPEPDVCSFGMEQYRWVRSVGGLKDTITDFGDCQWFRLSDSMKPVSGILPIR